MAREFTRVVPKTFPALDARETPEGAYWRRFRVPVVVKHASSVTSISFSPVSPHDYAVTSGTRLGLFDARHNSETRAFTRFKEPVYSAAWRADGRLIAVGTGAGSVVALTSTARQSLRTFYGHTGAARAVGFVRGGGDGEGALVFSSGDDASLRLWDVPTGASAGAVAGAHGDYVRCAAAPNGDGGLLGGSVLATGSYDHTVKLWDVRALRGDLPAVARRGTDEGRLAADADAVEEHAEAARVHAIADDDADDSVSEEEYGGDEEANGEAEEDDDLVDEMADGGGDESGIGDSFALSSGTTANRARGVGGGGCVLTVDHGEPVTSVVLLRGSGALVSTGGTTVKVWDVLGGGRLLASFSSHAKLVSAAALDGAGSRLLTAGFDGLLKVHDAATWGVVHTARFPGASLCALAVPPDNSRFAVGAADGTLWVRSRALRLGDALIEGQDAGLLRSGSYRYFVRGRGGAGARVEDISAGAAAGAKKPRLAPYEKALKAFDHSGALDAALAGGAPGAIGALLRELIARGALLGAISGRSAATLEPLLSFLSSHVASPRYSALCIDVIDVVADAYAPALASGGTGSDEGALAATLCSRLGQILAASKQELALGDSLLTLQGMMDVIVSSASANAANSRGGTTSRDGRGS